MTVERKIYEYIERFMRDKTCIIISHREIPWEIIDKVVYLEKGRIIKVELINKNC